MSACSILAQPDQTPYPFLDDHFLRGAELAGVSLMSEDATMVASFKMLSVQRRVTPQAWTLLRRES